MRGFPCTFYKTQGVQIPNHQRSNSWWLGPVAMSALHQIQQKNSRCRRATSREPRLRSARWPSDPERLSQMNATDLIPGILCMDEIRSHLKKPWLLIPQRKCQQTNGFNHGFRVVRTNCVHPEYVFGYVPPNLRVLVPLLDGCKREKKGTPTAFGLRP